MQDFYKPEGKIYKSDKSVVTRDTVAIIELNQHQNSIDVNT